MARLVFLSSLLLIPLRVVADYDQFYFSSNVTNWRCSKLAFDCIAPQVCAHESLLDKFYCCGPGSDSVCWSGAQDCSGSNGVPSSTQVGCGNNAFCCLNNREECTQRANQINICWATPENPFANVTEKELNKTFSSLSSARPSASSYSFNSAKLFASTTSGASSSATAASASTTATSSAASPTPTQGDSSGGISGGAIGGIVVGVVGGLAIIGAGCFFLWRRRSNNSKATQDGNPYNGNPNMYGGYGQVPQGSPVPHEKYGMHGAPLVPPTYPPVEMDATSQPVEVEGNKPQNNNI
ncbi:uncharacterized protein BDR25DRAFT_28302 [Lindgomyces ingoldianus]|uniref:Uncharacterized protein n=1 Tax=Lindgomyces ingoldianus TaxID=673940 RepID=A0ACB6QXX7_9PLEO|nr:uncharacterized protein BDR25DRAFT_28302 [Lindgomyces ingoldianus]KAF2470930.1 hypothetical protein BDR25DRAFT_28302 [Lindgomyces ingoldianus]